MACFRGALAACHLWHDKDDDELSFGSSDDEDEDFEGPEWQWDSLYFPPDMLVAHSASRGVIKSRGRDVSPKTPGTPALMAGSFLGHAAGLPDAGPPDFPPLCVHNLPGLSYKQVLEHFQAEPFILERLFIRDDGATDMKPAAWQDGTRIPGTRIRGTKFQIPMPDCPAAVRKMMAVPDLAGISAFFRWRSSDEQLDLVQQMITEHIPLGDCFRVQKTFSFSQGPAGVTFRHWVELIWIKPLPWALAYLKGYIESKAQETGKMNAGKLVDTLLQELS